MNKFCWIYENKKTGEQVLVQRPHRRAVNPQIACQRFQGDFSSWYFVLTRAQLRRQYRYVGRRKTAREILKPPFEARRNGGDSVHGND